MYADSWEAYAEKGWFPIPLPPGEKFPPPVGYTGANHKIPSKPQMRQWAKQKPDWNLGLVMPDNVIVLDVDCNDGKPGDVTLRNLIKKLGPLPLTVKSSRVSKFATHGHYYFKVPSGTKLVHSAGQSIDVLQYHHRYAVEWPSVNLAGDEYRWYDQDDYPDDEIPDIRYLTELPEKWVAYLTDNGSHSGAGFDGTVEEWLDNLPETQMSSAFIRKYNSKVRDLAMIEGSRHDTAQRTVDWLVHLGAEGHNVRDAIEDLRLTFVASVGSERDAEAEFNSMLSWAIRNFGEAE